MSLSSRRSHRRSGSIRPCAVAREVFKETQLTVADVEAAVRKVRGERHAAQGTKATGRR